MAAPVAAPTPPPITAPWTTLAAPARYGSGTRANGSTDTGAASGALSGRGSAACQANG
ncbi:hypothetical protein KUC_1286 [Vreelandella boliviensis LC1]|uniref:Uncharacterized protein n=1 Tax=Vreelandella boliviensis LC1 TaxID=1072583 RepID=A0A7U9C377_9GAMM|nr:hypothetical protein KUC_1286 [Halomonas boliviensis LC1]